MKTKQLGKPLPPLVAAMLALLLGGCVRAQMTIVVEPDGSGTLSLAIGMTQQAMLLAGTDVEGLMQTLSQEMSSQEEAGGDIVLRRWTEGEYEWVEASVPFADLQDLNSELSGTDLFESFSLTRKRGLLKDRFVLEARLAPDVAGGEGPESLLLDPGGMFEFDVSVRLPGEVTEHNGVFAGDLNTVSWTINDYGLLEMRAASETWNWLNIGVLSAIALVGALAAAGAAGVVLYRATRKRGSTEPAGDTPAPAPASQPASEPAEMAGSPAIPVDEAPPDRAAPADLLSELGVRAFLEEINQHMLGNRATIAEAADEIQMTWTAAPEGSQGQEIRIRVVDRETLTVNGVRVPATEDGVKQGLIAALRSTKKP